MDSSHMGTHLWTDSQTDILTDTTENITFPQLYLRMVIDAWNKQLVNVMKFCPKAEMTFSWVGNPKKKPGQLIPFMKSTHFWLVRKEFIMVVWENLLRGGAV